LKNAISELTNSEDPVSLNFDDFDEIADHPMAEKFMVSFEKLFE